VRTWAIFSEERCYRYALGRVWDEALPVLVFVMLNPSTADETEPDHTVTKCIGFAERNGFGGILVLNLWAWCSTDPEGLRAPIDPVGPENDEYLRYFASCADATKSTVLVAWGSNVAKTSWQRARAEKVLGLLVQSFDVHALKVSKGTPHHPLMLPYALKPALFRARRAA
jgi:hypothetical protein